MFCPCCRNHIGEGANFCRKCGAELQNLLLASERPNSFDRKSVDGSLTKAKSKDPDELTTGGIASVIIGDGLFMVGVILSSTESSVSSLLWLLLLIPAFYLFGKGIGDVLHGVQIRRALKQGQVDGIGKGEEHLLAENPIIATVKKQATGEPGPMPSVTEGTTRQLG